MKKRVPRPRGEGTEPDPIATKVGSHGAAAGQSAEVLAKIDRVLRKSR